MNLQGLILIRSMKVAMPVALNYNSRVRNSNLHLKLLLSPKRIKPVIQLSTLILLFDVFEMFFN